MFPRGLLKEYSQLVAILLRLLDVMALLLAGWVAHFYKFHQWSLQPEYGLALIASACLTLIVFQCVGVYDSLRAKSLKQYSLKLFQALSVLFMVLAGLAFISKTGTHYSREWFITWAVLSMGLLFFSRVSLFLFLRFMRARGWNERRVIVVGAGELGKQIVDRIQHGLWTGFRIVTLFDDDIENKPAEIKGIPVKKTPADLGDYCAVTAPGVDEVWLALPLRAEARVKEILHAMRHETVTTRFFLDMNGLELLNHSIAELAGFPLLNVRSSPMMGLNRFIKAVEDRVLAGFILLLISPLLMIIALTIKLTSKGPVFYKQKRVGWNNKEFDMLKFRTMWVNAEEESGPVWATPQENRTTWVGGFLRRTSLDELPQFINVILGDMSIVGPRPERLFFVEQFKDKVPRYMQKHMVKAGITGWAQVNGWRGQTSLEKRIESDLYYIENWSLWFDLQIIFLTVFKGFVHENAY